MRKLHNKVLILCLVTLLIDNRVMSNRNDKTSQCLIKNLHYKNEYLIATNYSDKYIDEGKFVYQNRKKAIIDKYIGILDKANKTKICKQVYAGVHNKSVEDADLVQFFKFKGWF